MTVEAPTGANWCCAKDYVETFEGLIFAVVTTGVVPVMTLRYRRIAGDPRPRKLATDSAIRILREQFPQYLVESPDLEMLVQSVPRDSVARYFSAASFAKSLLDLNSVEHHDRLLSKAATLLQQLIACDVRPDALGVSGSCLLNAHSAASDIDIVVYDRIAFRKIRDFVTNWNVTHPIANRFWEESYEKRGCSLSLEEYVWHEPRKNNKVWIGSTKVDFSLTASDNGPNSSVLTGTKVDRVTMQAEVVDDEFAFDHPGVWTIASRLATRLVSWTATYLGQVKRGEEIEVSGWLEKASDGVSQVVVGTSREASGEFIRVRQV